MTTTADLPAWAQARTDLTGKTALVIGGAGGVGEGITRQLLAAGATVIATARAKSKLDDLASRVDHPKLRTHALDLADPDLTGIVADLAREHGGLDGAVVSVADWGPQGPKGILDLADDEWDYLVEHNLTSVFRAFRALVPALGRTGALVHINGYSAEIPWPKHAALAVGSAATKSLARTLAAEAGPAGPRIHDLILGVISTRPKRMAGIDHPGWIPADEVGLHVAELIAGTSPFSGEVIQYFAQREVGPTTVKPEIG
ncbi:SDR family oxidoreductase [Glycomyces sp. NPDC048151]|uniref:SDR family oxidoreductase n=1 Tax=Glycomyces sp. NPDC048151 TaxID=3364002 RepID=UPI0037205405